MRRDELAENLYQAYRQHRKAFEHREDGTPPPWSALGEQKQSRFLAVADRVLWLFTSGQLGTEEE